MSLYLVCYDTFLRLVYFALFITKAHLTKQYFEKTTHDSLQRKLDKGAAAYESVNSFQVRV